MDSIMQVVNGIGEFMGSNQAPLLMVLGLLFTVAKGFSNEKAGVVVSMIQKGFDLVAKVCSAVGSVAQKGADLLALAVKSDGILGRK